MTRNTAFVLSLVLVGCKKDAPHTPTADAGPAPSASASAIPGAAPLQQDTEIKPVYPADAGPPNALAQSFCNAALDLPVQRLAACCKTAPGFSAASQCVRTLTFALASGAVELGAADVERCAAASTALWNGCDWVGSSAPAPAACQGVIRGKTAAQKLCRSSLECAPGLHCAGLSATRTGVCAPPRPEGAPCGGGIDTLAAYTAQLDADSAHPECAGGYCTSGRCVAFTAAGKACSASAQCGRGASCRDGRCSPQPLPAAGQRCAGQECADNLRCVGGTCVIAKDYGASCESDHECRGACLAPDGGGKGRCGMRCPSFAIPQTAPSAKRVSGPKRR